MKYEFNKMNEKLTMLKQNLVAHRWAVCLFYSVIGMPHIGKHSMVMVAESVDHGVFKAGWKTRQEVKFKVKKNLLNI